MIKIYNVLTSPKRKTFTLYIFITYFTFSALQLFMSLGLQNNSFPFLVWVRIRGKVTFILGVTYIHPVGSVYWKKGVLIDIEGELGEIKAKYQEERIIISGDFNARTGEMGGVVDIEDEVEQLLGRTCFGVRSSKDKLVNREGRELAGFCERMDLGILNGCKEGDREGSFTYISSMGCSVVDYGLGSSEIWINIKEFKVENRIESDHLPLKILLDGLNECDVERGDGNELSELKRYEWSEKNLESMRERMNSEHVKQTGFQRCCQKIK